jgi:hypothetical protein
MSEAVDHDHRRLSCTASSIPVVDVPVDRSRALSRWTISALVGRAAMLARSAATYADSDMPAAATLFESFGDVADVERRQASPNARRLTAADRWA